MAFPPVRLSIRWVLGASLFLVALAAARSPSPEGGQAAFLALPASPCPGALPILHLEGDPYTRGFQHGQVLREAVRQRGEKVLQAWASASAQYSSPPILPTARESLPEEVWEEVRGIADGARVSEETILLLNLWRPEDSAADGFLLVFTEAGSGSPYLGWVGKGSCEDAVLLVHRTAAGDTYALLGRAGQVGGVLGVNGAGLAGAVQRVSALDRRAWGVPAEVLLALGLARASAAEGASGQVAQARRAGGGAILWAEGASETVSLVEFTAHRHTLEAPQETLLWQEFRDPWLAELASSPSQGETVEERVRWLEANREWLGQEKAWAWLVGEAQRPGNMAALLDVTLARFWVAFGGGEVGPVGLGPVSLDELLAEAQ